MYRTIPAKEKTVEQTTTRVHCPNCKCCVEAIETSRSRYFIVYQCTKCSGTISVARW